LDRLPVIGATIVIGVPRLANGSGAPVAVTAFIP
jgi:kynurenine formamidase